MTDHSQYLSLLDAILRDPADDTPRLVLADWLEEQGDPASLARSEFIRVQVELHGRRQGPAGDVSEDSPWLANDSRYQALRRRERELLEANRDLWHVSFLGALAQAMGYPFTPETDPGPEKAYQAGMFLGALSPDHYQYRRGFVAEIKLTTAAFLRHAPAVFAAHPVESVGLTDGPDVLPVSRRPSSGGDEFVCLGYRYTRVHLHTWVRRHSIGSVLDDRLIHDLDGRLFPDEKRARAAFGRCLVNYTRNEAGLPDLLS